MDLVAIGVVTAGPDEPQLLADAVRHHPAVAAHEIALDDRSADTLAGLVVDAPLAQRGRLAADLARRWALPILIEMPVAEQVNQARQCLDECDHSRIYSLNPLCYRVPTQRLLEELAAADDPLESIFATWRFKQTDSITQALSRLVDFVGRVVGAAPGRMSAMTRESPAVLLALLRYPRDVVVSLEIGGHLPASLPHPAELLIECFSRDNAYQCQADNQTVSVDGEIPIQRDWSPPPEERMAGAFVEMLRGQRELSRMAADDVRVLALCEALRSATDRGNGELDSRQGADHQ